MIRFTADLDDELLIPIILSLRKIDVFSNQKVKEFQDFSQIFLNPSYTNKFNSLKFIWKLFWEI